MSSIFAKAIEAAMVQIREKHAAELLARTPVFNIPPRAGKMHRYIHGEMPFSVSDHLNGREPAPTTKLEVVRVRTTGIGITEEFFTELNRSLWRKHYRAEREFAELVDIGGES